MQICSWKRSAIARKTQSKSSFTKVSLTHSISQSEALVLHGCAHTASGVRPLFREVYFCCLGKHSQTETGFKTNVVVMKGENSITSYCIVLTFKMVKVQWLVQEILVL